MNTRAKMSLEELREMSRNITSDPSIISGLSAEETSELRKYINPLGGAVSADEKYAVVSIVNWRERYLRRLIMTSLVGLLFRKASEYEPVEELEKAERAYRRELESADASRASDITSQYEARVKTLKLTSRRVIGEFLESQFEYNPDKHVRGAHTSNPADPERETLEAGIERACRAANSASAISEKLRKRLPDTFSYVKDALLYTYQTVTQLSSSVEGMLKAVSNPSMPAEDTAGILLKKYSELNALAEDMSRVAKPLSAAETLSAWEVNPPVDAFSALERYTTNHYESLREVVAALYHEKPDFEFALTFYDSFDTPEEAREYCIAHEGDFRQEPTTVRNNGVTLVGPFKENRERVDYYTKNTEILKLMNDQLEADHKLGRDLMEKKVRETKKRNVVAEGVDNPAIAAYSRAQNEAQALGARKILSYDEQVKLAKAREIIDDYELPDEAIQVDVFGPGEDSEGNPVLVKSKFFTQAEAPLDRQESSDYREKYQPIREAGLKNSYKSKTVIDRNGKKTVIKVPRGEK